MRRKVTLIIGADKLRVVINALECKAFALADIRIAPGRTTPFCPNASVASASHPIGRSCVDKEGMSFPLYIPSMTRETELKAIWEIGSRIDGITALQDVIFHRWPVHN